MNAINTKDNSPRRAPGAQSTTKQNSVSASTPADAVSNEHRRRRRQQPRVYRTDWQRLEGRQAEHLPVADGLRPGSW